MAQLFGPGQTIRLDSLGLASSFALSGGSGTVPVKWMDSAYDSRLLVTVPNSSGNDLHDHLVNLTLPAGVTVDNNSLRAVEVTSLGGIEHAYDWRYGTAAGSANRLPNLPLSISGATVTIKTLGLWPTGQTRYFHLYWNLAGGIAAPDYHHLDVVASGWTATITAGTAGDIYALVVGGTTYSYPMIGGDTPTTIAVALKNLINAGVVATASNAAGVLTITTTTPRTPFTVTVGGSTTVPANLVVVKPQFLKVARTGPDTEAVPANATYQLGLPSFGTGTAAFLALGQPAATSRFLRQFRYQVNGDATYYGAQDATISTISVDGPTITVTGTITFSTRASGVDWSGTFTATYQNRVAALQKTDQTGSTHAINKSVDLVRMQITYTCQRAHTPKSSAANGSGFAFYGALELQTSGNFSGNTTTVAGEQLPLYYATGSTATAYVSSTTDLSAIAVNSTIMGQAGNNYAAGFLVNSAVISGFGAGQSSAILRWFNNGAGLLLQIAGLTNGATIPVNATITLDYYYGQGVTQNAITAGDNLTPDELVGRLRGVSTVLTPTVAATVERYSPASLLKTIKAASDQAVIGAAYYRTNALALTGLANNIAYQYDVQAGTVAPCDDDDGTYGVGHLLHGHCLKYKRTHDASLIAAIEALVNYHLNIEAAAVALYGSYWNGSAPYWYWPKATASGAAYNTEGGCSGGVTAAVDPGFGGALGNISYTQGQPRRLTSIDQMHMTAHGLYAYLYILASESAITANTTLRTNALNYLSRMQTFEAAHWNAQDRVIDNLYAICSGGTPSHNNGITATQLNSQAGTALANPYRGDQFPAWEDSNGDALLMTASSNSTVDYFFRAVFAPDSVESGVRRFMQGQCFDMEAMDLGRHDVTTTQSTWGYSTSNLYGSYPPGWAGRSQATSNNWRYNVGRATDKHYMELASGGSGARDMLAGRVAQRAIVLAFASLLDPSLVIPVEINGASVVRSVPVQTALDDMMRVLCVYGTEPTTGAQRWAASAYFGGTGSQLVDAAFSGYWLMAIELYLLARSNLAAYYKFVGV